MEILLTVTATAGRLTGTVRGPGSDLMAFSGSLELLACLERLVTGTTADPLTEPLTTKGR
jgi:hypothetical protein